nr:MAG TPA: hypothetical protein [Microviridae sp.]
MISLLVRVGFSCIYTLGLRAHHGSGVIYTGRPPRP